jgi:P-type conjugative transfer protein TrbJ
MRPRSNHRPILIGTAAVILALATVPAAGQMVVYDPSNYAQNVLQAARALQQINNQVTSLQNQTQMLLNQARNLVTLNQFGVNSRMTSRSVARAFLGFAVSNFIRRM